MFVNKITDNNCFFINGFEGQKFTQIASAANRRYYQISDSELSLFDRIKAIAGCILSYGIERYNKGNIFNDRILSGLRQGLYGKKELLLEGNILFEASRDLPNVDQNGMKEIIDTALSRYTSNVSCKGQKEVCDLEAPRTLKENFGKLTNVKGLDLCNCDIQRIQYNFGDNVKLESLCLANNKLSYLPDSFVNLQNLQKLDLSGNQFTEIPEIVFHLPPSSTVNLNGNPLSPESIGNVITRMMDPEYFGPKQISFAQLNPAQIRRGSLISMTLYPPLPPSPSVNHAPQENGPMNPIEQQPSSGAHVNHAPVLQEHLNAVQHQLPPHAQIHPLTAIRLPQLESGVLVLFSSPVRLNHAVNYDSDANYQARRPARVVLEDWCSRDTVQKLLGENETLRNRVHLWLDRLQSTSDYLHNPGKLKEKIKPILEWLSQEPQNSSYKARAYTILEGATSTCDDRPTTCLNDLSILIKLSKSGSLPLNQVKDLIISMDRYDKLMKIARDKIQSLKEEALSARAAERLENEDEIDEDDSDDDDGVDELEVYLRYQTALKDALKLPLEADSMLFEHACDVTDEDINKAKAEILKETGDAEKQLQILLKNEAWIDRLEKEEEFKKVKQKCDGELQAYMGKVDTSDMKAMRACEKEVKLNNATKWNPHYMMTRKLLGLR